MNQMVTAGRGTPILRVSFEFLFPNSTEITNDNIFKGWRTGQAALRVGNDKMQMLFSCSVMSNSLRPHEPQQDRPPCPSPTLEVHPNPCPSSRRCHPTISSFVVPFSSCPQSFPASGSFQMSQLFTSGGQRIGVSASAWVLPMNTQDWSPLGWTGWISLESKGL